MSIVPSWGQAQQPLGLPYSITQMQAQPIAPQQAPMPPQLACSPTLQPFVQHIAQTLVQAVQAGAQNNVLRLFFYNQVSVNGYQNQEYLDILTKLVSLVDTAAMVVGVSNSNQALQLIQEWVDIYVTYRVANNLTKYPALAQSVPPAGLQQAQQVIGNFNHRASTLEMAMQQRMSPQAQWMASGSGFQQAPQTQASWVDQAVRNVPQPAWLNQGTTLSASSMPAWQKDTTASWRDQPAQPTQSLGQSASRRADVVNSKDSAAEADARNPAVVTPTRTRSTPPVTQPTSFERSDEMPYDFVYDHNLYEKQYLAEDGVTRPVVKRKTAMDRTLHLGKPSFARHWTKPPTAEQFRKKVEESKAAAPQEQLVEVVGKLDEYLPTSSEAEIWKRVQSVAAIKRTNSKRIICATQAGLLVDTVISSTDFKPLVADLLLADDPTTTGAILKAARRDAGENMDDLIAINAINERLTKRINRFVKKEMALQYGSISDYADDIDELAEFLGTQYGAGVKNTFLDNHASMVAQALQFFTDEDQVNDLTADVLGAYPEEERSLVNMLHFRECVGFTQVDLSTAELSFEMGLADIGYGINESTSPVLHAVVSAIVEAYDSSDTEYDRQLLRTTDGVEFQVDKAALNKKYNLISLVK